MPLTPCEPLGLSKLLILAPQEIEKERQEMKRGLAGVSPGCTLGAFGKLLNITMPRSQLRLENAVGISCRGLRCSISEPPEVQGIRV